MRLHVVSDSLIALACLTIPVTLIYIARKRKDLPFNWMFACFGVFILACGATHALEVWTLWHPTYWLSGTMKAITAASSIATAILLVRLIPRLLAIPSPINLQQSNAALEMEIAERKQASALLLESQQRLALASESARIGIWDWDVVTGQLVWDAQMYELYGLDEKDFSGAYDAWQKGLHPEDRPRAEFEINVAVEGANGFHTEFRVQWPNGEVRDIEAHGVVRHASNGSTTRMIGVNWDITRRKRAEEALRESNEKFRHLADNITDAFWIRSADLREVHYVSPAFERISGRPLASLYADPQQWADFILPEDRQRVSGAFAELSADAASIDIECRLVRPDGEIRWIRVRGFQVRNARDQLIRHVGIMTDITERKQAEEEIERLNTYLEQRVARRTEDLFAMTQEADLANRAKSEFLSRTSHELRTPMNAILGFGQLLEMEEDLRPEVRDSVTRIVHAGRHLLALIDEVLDISNAEFGGLKLALEPVEVDSLVEEALRRVQPLCAKFQIELDLAAPVEKGWSVLADSERLKQVLHHLLTNAIQYNHPGGKVILECTPGEAADPQVFRFRVNDTGCGISPGSLPRLFTPFDRLDAERTQLRTVGTGLGLTVSKRIIEQMGGHIGVETVWGEGSTFWIELPMVRISTPPDESIGPGPEGSR